MPLRWLWARLVRLVRADRPFGPPSPDAGEHALRAGDFVFLATTASRHHLRTLAEPLGLTVHARRGALYFRDAAGREVPTGRVHELVQADPVVARWAYNLYMFYNVHG